MMRSQESATDKKRIFLDSIQNGLRGFFWLFAFLVGLTFLSLIFRAESFSSDSSRSIFAGLTGLTILTLLLSGLTHLFRELKNHWAEFPFWADEFHSWRDHLLISFPVIATAFFLLFHFRFSLAILPFFILLAGESFWIFRLPAWAEKIGRGARLFCDGLQFEERGESSPSVPQASNDKVVSGTFLQGVMESTTVSEGIDSKKSLGGLFTEEDVPEGLVEEDLPSEGRFPEESVSEETGEDNREETRRETVPFQGGERESAPSPEESDSPQPAPFLPTLFDGTSETIRFDRFPTENETRSPSDLDSPHPDPLEDEEFSDEGEEFEEEPSTSVLATTERTIGEEGKERIEGWFRVRFQPEEETTIIHLSFCPPFETVPDLQLIQIAGGEVQFKATQIETFGARIEVKRNLSETREQETEDHEEKITVTAPFSDESVRICYFAMEK